MWCVWLQGGQHVQAAVRWCVRLQGGGDVAMQLRGAQQQGACEAHGNVACVGRGVAMWPCDWEGMATGRIWLGEVWRHGRKVNWGSNSAKAKA